MERSRFQLAQKDAVAWLRTLADTSVDLIITDPPYESLEKHRAVGTTTRLKNSKASSNDWFEIFPNERFEELFLELFRVLKKDRHFYLFCDAETMFVAKPIGERVGFKFWKPLIWDKCLGPDTLVWSERGVVRIADLEVGDRVAVPEGGTARVRGVRSTRSPARRLQLADGTELIASLDHRLVLADGRQVETRELGAGDRLARRPIQLERVERLRVGDLEPIDLDHDLGKLVGLFAVAGAFTPAGVSFALHGETQPSRDHIGRMAAALGARACVYLVGDRAQVTVDVPIAREVLEHFVGKTSAASTHLRPAVYAAPDEFQRGVLAGLIEAGGHWSSDEQRETVDVASVDLASFVQRGLASRGAVTIDYLDSAATGWRVRHDPRPPIAPDGVAVESIADAGVTDLVDISIDHPDELFILANGVVSHNCKIGMGYHYRARYECILFFEKGKRKLNDLGVADIIEVPRVYRGYPAEKPPEVSSVLVEQSTEPGELVIDPFCGSGSAGVAAARAGRCFAGNDICAEAVDIAYERIREAGAIPDPQLVETGPSGGVQLGLGIG